MLISKKISNKTGGFIRKLLTAPTPYGVGFQEGLPAPRSVGYAAILKPQGHLAAA